MVGDGPERSGIIDEIHKRRLDDRALLPGNVDHAEVRLWYHAIDLFVVPRIADFASDYVTPLKPFEAMSQGIPVIMSDRPVTAEIAGQSGERAAIFPAGDDQALAEAILAEFSDMDRLHRRARQAREWVLSERVWSSVVTRYDEAYEQARRRHFDRQGSENVQ
jgi:glycosyltransferase involved in cell wall biosynthesis